MSESLVVGGGRVEVGDGSLMRSGETFPQRLKPEGTCDGCGTTRSIPEEVVP